MNDTGDDVFQLQPGQEGAWTTLTLVGEFDTHAAMSFDRVVNDLTMHHDPKLLIDMSGVSFVDSSGLRSLVRARTRVGGKDALVLRGPRAATVRLLEITGLLDEFNIA
jgi:anti-sigma B factor antagonist